MLKKVRLWDFNRFGEVGREGEARFERAVRERKLCHVQLHVLLKSFVSYSFGLYFHLVFHFFNFQPCFDSTCTSILFSSGFMGVEPVFDERAEVHRLDRV